MRLVRHIQAMNTWATLRWAESDLAYFKQHGGASQRAIQQLERDVWDMHVQLAILRTS